MSRESRDAAIASFQTFSTWEVRRKSADSVDLLFLNPIWISGKSLASSATLLSLAAVIASISLPVCCGLYYAILTEYKIKGEMWKAGWFLQKRSVKKCEEVW